jgi:phosphatidylglycerophosphate synthase
MALASVVTYARARAEAVGLHGEVGVAPRPERLVLIALGLVGGGAFGGITAFDVQCPGGMGSSCVDPAGSSIWSNGDWILGGALALISLLSAITVAQRILHVRSQSTEG